MGACGCGDQQGMWTLPGPDGTTYVLDIYPGCMDCDTPAGVTIDKMTNEDLEDFCMDDLAPLPLNDGMGGISVVHPQHVMRLILAEMGDGYPDDDGTNEYLEDVVPEAVRDAAVGCCYQGWRRSFPVAKHEGDYSERLGVGFRNTSLMVEFGHDLEVDIKPGDQVWRTVVGRRADYVLVRDGKIVTERLDRFIEEEKVA